MKNTKMKVAIIVLCLLVVGLVGFIVYNNFLNQENNELGKQVRYYQYYTEINVQSEVLYKSSEIELNVDNTARWYFGGNSSGGDEYIGTYIENADKITLTLSRNMTNGVVCDDNQSAFPCNTTLVLTKINNDTLVSVSELGNDDVSYTYIKTTKDSLKYIR